MLFGLINVLAPSLDVILSASVLLCQVLLVHAQATSFKLYHILSVTSVGSLLFVRKFMEKDQSIFSSVYYALSGLEFLKSY